MYLSVPIVNATTNGASVAIPQFEQTDVCMDLTTSLYISSPY